ncbi:FadR/GntR family transcriptional regulator [uncultured Microbacterium sp.]|uniref:FadR/GntR family transcriptional regulator n=1 Tax=uncultured Microbacterium sp. TaxID=191216 RepID=UPI0035C9B0D7
MSDAAVTSGRSTHAVIFRPVDSSERPSAIVERIQSAISVGVFADGEPLPAEQELARLFEVPPFRLREALRILRDQGLIVTKRGRGGGSFVRLPEGLNSSLAAERLQSIATIELRDLLDWREMLTVAAVRLAIDRADQRNIDHLRDQADILGEARVLALARRAHSRFYLELAASAQSVRMSSAEIELQAQFGWVVGAVIDIATYRSETSEKFRSIADAIERRDPEGALLHAAAHSQQLSQRLMQQRVAFASKEMERK